MRRAISTVADRTQLRLASASSTRCMGAATSCVGGWTYPFRLVCTQGILHASDTVPPSARSFQRGSPMVTEGATSSEPDSSPRSAAWRRSEESMRACLCTSWFVTLERFQEPSASETQIPATLLLRQLHTCGDCPDARPTKVAVLEYSSRDRMDDSQTFQCGLHSQHRGIDSVIRSCQHPLQQLASPALDTRVKFLAIYGRRGRRLVCEGVHQSWITLLMAVRKTEMGPSAATSADGLMSHETAAYGRHTCDGSAHLLVTPPHEAPISVSGGIRADPIGRSGLA
jgi:hypothetical protein